MLDGVSSVNDFDYVDQAEFTQGDTIQVYFQLIDASQDKPSAGFKPAGRRYMPPSGATLSVVIDNGGCDFHQAITRSAVQAFPTSDPSIWYLQIMGTDQVRGTVDLQLKLTVSGVITYGRATAALAIVNQGCL